MIQATFFTSMCSSRNFLNLFGVFPNPPFLSHPTSNPSANPLASELRTNPETNPTSQAAPNTLTCHLGDCTGLFTGLPDLHPADT